MHQPFLHPLHLRQDFRLHAPKGVSLLHRLLHVVRQDARRALHRLAPLKQQEQRRHAVLGHPQQRQRVLHEGRRDVFGAKENQAVGHRIEHAVATRQARQVVELAWERTQNTTC